MRLEIRNSGFFEEIEIADEDLANVHVPLLERFSKLSESGRAVIMLAGPPGSGKGVVCEAWRILAERQGAALVVVSLDGFHYPNAYLAERDMLDCKGSPETFDVRGLSIALAQLHAGTPLVWPVYDRNLHEPVSAGVPISDQRLIVIEGNYLLLDEPHWSTLRRYATMTVRLDVDRACLRERVVARHVRGGRSRAEAEARFVSADLKNIIRVTERSVHADVVLFRESGGHYRLLEGGERTL